VPPLGTVLLLLVYLAFVLALEFHNNNTPDAQHYTALGVRAGWLAIAQMPLLILLAGKNNLIGFVTGVSYERLNVFHRWVARMILLLATLHFGYQSYGWNRYGLVQLEWSTDSCPPTGIAAYAILLWVNLSTLAPIRNFSYEFFVIQHLVTFFGFIIAIMLHLPSTALYSRLYIYIPIGLYLLDRLIRTSRYADHNMHPSHATLTPLAGSATKIRLHNQRIKTWTPGSHMLLSIPTHGLGQSHPATILSTPTSHNGDLVFILKSHKGFTNRILTSTRSRTTSLLPQTEKEATSDNKQQQQQQQQEPHLTLLDGPYGGTHADFCAFDTVLLIAGSTGVTFTLAILLDIAFRAGGGGDDRGRKIPVRRIDFIWVIKQTSWTEWISGELASASRRLREEGGVELAIEIFVTCDDAFTDQGSASTTGKGCGCQCDRKRGPCCCTSITTTTDTNTASLETAAASLHSGRPPLPAILETALGTAEGETGIAVCGPLGLSTSLRNTVARLSDERAVHKGGGGGALGVYLHVEGFGW